MTFLAVVFFTLRSLEVLLVILVDFDEEVAVRPTLEALASLD